MNYQELQKEIIATAKKYVGMQEIKGNLGWLDKSFEAKMESIGWKMKHEWCAYFAELVWSEVYDKVGLRKVIDKCFSGSSTRTYTKFEANGWNVGRVPTKGAVVIWCRVSKGVESWKGHTGLVVDVHDGYMDTIEGNTNEAGNPDGQVVAEKKRKYNFKVNNGLQLVGFIYPKGIEPHVPFNNKSEGNKFRTWVNNNYPEYAKEIDLDKRGSFFNSYITKAWLDKGVDYNI